MPRRNEINLRRQYDYLLKDYHKDDIEEKERKRQEKLDYIFWSAWVVYTAIVGAFIIWLVKLLVGSR